MSKSTRILLIMGVLVVLGDATVMNAAAYGNPYEKACENSDGKWICETNPYTQQLNCSCDK